MKFEDTIEYVLQFEGSEYTNDPADHGGETKFGVSKRAHPNVDIKNLTKEQAIQIYRKDYWEPNKDIFTAFTSAVECYSIIARFFDCIVNIGRKNTIIVIQRAFNALPINEDLILKEDGILGEITKKQIEWTRERAYFSEFETAFSCERAAYYRVLAAKDPSQEKFLKGWLRRAHA